MCEQVIHLFQGQVLGFWQEEVEEDRVCEVANDE